MPESLTHLTNPYASPGSDESSEPADANSSLKRTSEVWLATSVIWSACLSLALAAGYILLAWCDHKNPRWNLNIDRADQLAQFATGAANAIVLAGLMAYGQYHAVIRRDLIWTRTIALLLTIATMVIGLGAVLIFAGTTTMWLLLVPAAIAMFLSLLMFRWYNRLFTFRKQQRRVSRGVKLK